MKWTRRQTLNFGIGCAAAGWLGLPATRGAAPVTTSLGDDLHRLSADAVRRYWAVKPHPGELKWEQIPWLIDLPEGIRLAKQERRPILIWVSGDDPLERC